LRTALPENWKRACIKNTDEILFINIDDNTIHGVSPIDEAALVHYTEQKEKLEKNKAPSKIIPKTKNLPPIKKGEEGVAPSKPQLPPVKKDKSPIRDSKSNTPVNDLSRDEVLKPKHEVTHEDKHGVQEVKNTTGEKKPKKDKKESKFAEPKKEEPHVNVNSNVNTNKANNLYSNLMPGSSSMNKGDAIYNIPISMSFGEVPEFKNTVEVVDDIKPGISKPSDIGNYNTSKKSAQKFNVKDYDISEQESTAKEILKDYKPTRTDTNKEKKEYYHTKVNELKDFENILKEKVIKEKADYKTAKEQLKTRVTYQYAEKLKELEKQYSEVDNDPEIIELKRSLEKELEEKARSSLKPVEDDTEVGEYENKMERLENERHRLLEEIERVKKLQDKPVSDDSLKGVRDLLAEKFEMDKLNIKRKYELMEKEMTIQEEDGYNREIDSIKKNFESNAEAREKLLANSFNKILDDFQKTLENDFNMQSKAIMSELQLTGNDEYKDYQKKLEQEKEDQKGIFKKEIESIEKSHSHGMLFV
jgi:hypothetical protein